MKINLANTQLFRGIDSADIAPLLSCLGVIERSFKKGAIILAEGEPTDLIGVVLSGRALIEYCDVWGNHSILGNAAPGAVFAESYACIPGEPLQISVLASEDTSVLFLNVGKVLTTCTNSCEFHTKLIRNLLTVCANKSLELSRRILHSTSKSIRGRLMSYFSECIKKSGSYSFEIPYNREQLASYLGVDRSAMSNELSKMKKEGLIQYRKNHFTIIEPATLS